MKITVIENGVARNENVKVANRVIANVDANNRKNEVGVFPIPGCDGYYANIEKGIVFGKSGYPVGSIFNNRCIVGIFKDGKTKTYLRSRLIASAAIGRDLAKGEEVDHINNITHDDRLENLAICNHKDNCNNILSKQLRANKGRKRNRSQKLVLNAPVAEFKHINVEKAK